MKSIFRYLIGGFLFLSVLLFLQIAGGKYDGSTLQTIIWLVGLYIIPIIIVTFHINSKEQMPVEKNMATIIKITSLSLVFLTIATVLIQPIVRKNTGLLPNQVLVRSLYILMPLQGLLDFFLIRVFKSKKSFTGNSQYDIFLSYSRIDEIIAERLYSSLKSVGLSVCFDKASMRPGENIENFVKESSKSSRITVCIISESSLKSEWVTLEILQSLVTEQFNSDKKFIACYLDDFFLSHGASLKLASIIDKEIFEIQDLIKQGQKRMINSRDLNNNLTRLFTIRNNIDQIVQRLKDSLCLNVSGENYSSSLKLLIEEIKR